MRDCADRVMQAEGMRNHASALQVTKKPLQHSQNSKTDYPAQGRVMQVRLGLKSTVGSQLRMRIDMLG